MKKLLLLKYFFRNKLYCSMEIINDDDYDYLCNFLGVEN